jgi:hypothetical protein
MLYRFKVMQQWNISTYFNGTTLMTVQADSEEEAKEKIKNSVKESNGECEEEDLISEVYDPNAPLYWYSWSLWLHPDRETNDGEPLNEPIIEPWDPIMDKHAQIDVWRNKATVMLKKIQQYERGVEAGFMGCADLEGDEMPATTKPRSITVAEYAKRQGFAIPPEGLAEIERILMAEVEKHRK